MSYPQSFVDRLTPKITIEARAVLAAQYNESDLVCILAREDNLADMIAKLFQSGLGALSAQEYCAGLRFIEAVAMDQGCYNSIKISLIPAMEQAVGILTGEAAICGKAIGGSSNGTLSFGSHGWPLIS
ncbi:MAG: hypothetical protein J0L97_04020 [Alphaproteobacteria bacterium]|nr:hypothetical protein [Alphaproteobacteria bacterium]